MSPESWCILELFVENSSYPKTANCVESRIGRFLVDYLLK